MNIALNGVFPSLHGGSLEITLTVPLILIRILRKERKEINEVLFFPDHTIDTFDKQQIGDKIFKVKPIK